jgi:hypothetical protein
MEVVSINQSSILAKPVVESILNTARQHLEQTGRLAPALFIVTGNQKAAVLPLLLPATPGEKQVYFRQLGHQIRASGRTIVEAVMVTEAWYVENAPAMLEVRPSQHPCRRETVLVTGRNAEGNRFTHVIQPFTRTADAGLVWQKVPLAVYDQPLEAGAHAEGLLDFLFDDPTS